MIVHESGEDYLEALYLLQKDLSEVRSVNLAEFLGYSKPSITNMIRILIEAGMVKKGNRGILTLTDKGMELAKITYEKHCFFYKMLINAGIDEQSAQKEACKLEHNLSKDSYQKLRSMFEKIDLLNEVLK